jgi:hypothetical protein
VAAALEELWGWDVPARSVRQWRAQANDPLPCMRWNPGRGKRGAVVVDFAQLEAWARRCISE